MKPLPELYQKFHNAILTQDSTLAVPDLKHQGVLTPEQRMAIYIDGYRLRLRQAIASDYPALLDYMGDTDFDRLALDYIECAPPTHYNLDRYPFGFAAYVAQQAGDPFAHDLARLEGAIAEVFIDKESQALSPASIDPDQFADAILRPRFASRLLALAYPAHLWLTAQRDGMRQASPAAAPTFLYVYRHEHEVQRQELSPQAYRLLTALCAGKPVSVALESVPNLSEKETEACFASWLSKGVFRQ